MSDEKSKQLAEERRAHNQRVESLRDEGAYSREINDEYQQHQQRVAAILGDEDRPCVGSGCRTT